MQSKEAVVAQFAMPRLFGLYGGNVYVVLPNTPSADLVAWCKDRPYVVDVQVGTIEATSLTIVLTPGRAAEVAVTRIHRLVHALAGHLDLTVVAELVTIVEGNSDEPLTPVMRFLTKPHYQQISTSALVATLGSALHGGTAASRTYPADFLKQRERQRAARTLEQRRAPLSRTPLQRMRKLNLVTSETTYQKVRPWRYRDGLRESLALALMTAHGILWRSILYPIFRRRL